MASLKLSLFDFLVRSSNNAYGTRRGLRLLFKSCHRQGTKKTEQVEVWSDSKFTLKCFDFSLIAHMQ